MKLYKNDYFIVISRENLEANDIKVLNLLYQPVIGPNAISVFLTLFYNIDYINLISIERKLSYLEQTLCMSLEDIKLNMEKLEGIGLLRTYIKTSDNINNYVFNLYLPLKGMEFFNNPILNILLFNQLGKSEYDNLNAFFKGTLIPLDSYKEITKPINEVFNVVPSNFVLNDKDKITRGNINLLNKVDIDKLKVLIPNTLINKNTFTSDVIDLLNKVIFLYNVDEIKLSEFIITCIDENCIINKDELRKLVQSYYKFENASMPKMIEKKDNIDFKINSELDKIIHVFETTNPVDFLRSKYKDSIPTKRDLSLVESLLLDTNLNIGVINVLIDYVLKTNNQKLPKAFIETIAGQWARLNIKTAKEAILLAQSEHKKYYKQSKTIEKEKVQKELPDWFDKKQEKNNVDSTTIKQMKDMLKSFE